MAATGLWRGLHPGMALAAKGMVLVFVILSVAFLDQAGALYSEVRAWIERTLDWYYVLTVCGAVFVSLFLMCSRYGNIRLGDDDARPEFSTFSWLAMLFSAGLGIGLLFFSIAEPLYYLDNSAPGGYPNNPHADRAGALLLDVQRAEHAVRVTYMHWGIHAWSVYVIVGLCLAWFGFRKKLPLTLRSALYPVIGERIYGTPGHLVDLLAVFGTVFGVATSLGLGVKQMGAGLDTLFGLDPGIVEGAHRLQRGQHAEDAVELAAVGLSVEVTTGRHGRKLRVAPRAPREHVAHLVHGDGAPGPLAP